MSLLSLLGGPAKTYLVVPLRRDALPASTLAAWPSGHTVPCPALTHATSSAAFHMPPCTWPRSGHVQTFPHRGQALPHSTTSQGLRHTQGPSARIPLTQRDMRAAKTHSNTLRHALTRRDRLHHTCTHARTCSWGPGRFPASARVYAPGATVPFRMD